MSSPFKNNSQKMRLSPAYLPAPELVMWPYSATRDIGNCSLILGNYVLISNLGVLLLRKKGRADIGRCLPCYLLIGNAEALVINSVIEEAVCI